MRVRSNSCRPLLASIAVLLVALVNPRPIRATDRRVLTVAELVSGANAVVVSRLESSRSEWQRSRIVTRHRLRIAEVWRGDLKLDTSVSVLTLGGVVGDIGQRVNGQISLPADAELVLFLTEAGPDTDRHYRIVGMTQGVFNIKRAPGDLDGLVLRDQFAPNVDQQSPILTLLELRRAVEAAPE
ncbi:MAG: hypothetical protein AAF605_07390 [Myxococcota bacterium]